MISKLLALFIMNVFTANFILFRFLGMCPFIGVSKRRRPAFFMSLAVIFVMLVSSIITWIVYQYVLLPMGISYLKTVVFILVIASAVQAIDLIMLKTMPGLHKTLGIYLPLITTNCAIMGVAVLNIEAFGGMSNKAIGLLYAVAQALFAGIGFMLAIMLMSGIRERLELIELPRPFRGMPIAFIIAALLSLSFMGFIGIGGS